MRILFHRHTPFSSKLNCSTKIYLKEALEAGHEVYYLERIIGLDRVFKYPLKMNSRSKSVLLGFSLGVVNRFWPFNTVKAFDFFYKNARFLKRLPEDFFDVIWTVPSGSSALTMKFKPTILVHQVVDYYPAYQGPYVKALEKSDYQRADLILCISHGISEYISGELQIKSEKIFTIGQGFYTDRYRELWDNVKIGSKADRKRFVYVGKISKLDRDLTAELIRYINQNKFEFIIAGTDVPSWIRPFINSGSVTFLGAISPNKIPDLLLSCDVGIMLYNLRNKDIYKGQNPLKLYEYAGAGLDIISTDHYEYRYLKPPVKIVYDSDSLLSALISPRLSVEEVVSFSNKFSWRENFRRIEKIIEGKKDEKEKITSIH